MTDLPWPPLDTRRIGEHGRGDVLAQGADLSAPLASACWVDQSDLRHSYRRNRQLVKHRAYYSTRTGRNPNAVRVNLDMFRKLFRSVYDGLDAEGYFQEYCGYHCVDAGFVPGKLGHDLSGAVLLAVRKENLIPIHERLAYYAEDDLFDVIEFLHDHCSKPTASHFHDYGGCGIHASAFDQTAGRTTFRERVAPILELYGGGFELNHLGEVLALADDGLQGLFEAPVPSEDPQNIEARIEEAKRRFRRHRSTPDERRHAIRDLADVLEFLRPQLTTVLTKKDEADLFAIVNRFGIRHHNDKQQVDYDQAIFYSWLFYYYLATLHAALRLIRRASTENPAKRPQT